MPLRRAVAAPAPTSSNASLPVTVTRRPLIALAAALLGGLVVVLGLAGAARAAAATKIVAYHGYRVTAPAGWPVYRLAAHPRTCVRFDRHAVYLGRPGARQDCPPHAAGRTEAILVSPTAQGRGAGADSRVLAPAQSAGATPSGGSVAEVLKPADHVAITATWRRDPATIRDALGVRSVTAAARSYARRSAAAAPAPAARAAAPGAAFPVTPTGAGSPGAIDTGLGFDACSTPSTATLSAWLSSPFRALGVYIGGANMACSQPNLTPAWVTAETGAGWHLMPIYVGLQAPSSGCGCSTISPAGASSQGAAAATDAIAHARALGLGAGNPVYYDMEGYARGSSTSPAVLAFLGAWTTQLHLDGYESAVYSSESSGIEDLVAQYGSGYAEPDDIWIANWNGQQSTADSQVPVTDWASHQRVHQFEGGHTDDYGGAQINIDGDYLDAATASPGNASLTTTIAAAPSVSVRPAADGTIDVYPSWSGAAGISSWRIAAGFSATALAPTMTVRAGARLPIVIRSAYPYFQVQALDSSGRAIGSSGVTAAPAHVAIFGHSSFVPVDGPGGLPVACYGIASCQVSTTVSNGRHTLASTRPQRVPAGGGIVHFDLSRATHRLVVHAAHQLLPVTVTVRSTTGAKATRLVNLVPFTVAGRAPRRSVGAGAGVRILGETDFVSHGWSGGILASCAARIPCSATPTVTAGGGHLVSISRPQALGAHEVGYLSFRMTSAGHAMLRAVKGNQLGARIAVTTAPTATGAASTARALISLDSF